MTSGTAVRTAAHSMAWTNERLKLSCADGIGFKSLWKMLMLDKNGTRSNSDVSVRVTRDEIILENHNSSIYHKYIRKVTKR